ncbi:hypothetical protein M9Y10_029392 [Tritrichomonas musculus]|uniref:Uncharacterized protein n=1 Tax=Tritrichomonas musculus TaxID=1915356 RepID=A0ABR2KM08_9EUKA
MNFEGKSIFITGASNGLGKTIALSFAKKGSSLLILTGRDENRLQSIVNECKKFCQNTMYVTGDMSNTDDIDKISTFVEEKTKNKLNIFIGNHGTISPQGTGNTSINSSMDNFNHIINVNFTSNVRLTNRLCRIMVNGSSIVFITSINSTFAASNNSAYCSSKAALSMFMKCSALDLGSRGIRVNSVAPGTMFTDFNSTKYESKEMQSQELKKIGDKLPVNHLTTTQGVSNAVLFLASDLAKDITGIEQTVDCGQSLILGES